MDKIQIRFNESDYNLYYDYCLKYYQVQTSVRKQSLHAFLDLFEKSIIIVDDQEIDQARKFLSGKCETLKKEQYNLQRKGESTMLFQIQICSDLLLFIDDLEKIFRLIQKQGVAANYLMILATFSKVIEENRNLQISALYDIDPDVIESLARPLAENIQLRLGTDRHWRSVLRELTVIAARFNEVYPEPEFDLEIILLVGPAVVAHFDKDVETREILSALPSYFEESELEEFEAFLNRTPEILRDDENAEINWNAIYDPLNFIANVVAAQRNQWSQSRLNISDRHSMVPTMGTPSPPGGLYPLAIPGTPSSNLPQTMEYKTFDIIVSPDSPTQVDYPQNIYPVYDPGAARPGIRSLFPAIIGVIIISLLIIGALMGTGILKFAGSGNSTNQSVVAADNITITTSPTTPQVTTVIPTAPPVATPSPTPQRYTSSEIGDHLVEIAFGPDNNVIQKPSGDRVAVTFSGSFDENDLIVLNNFINRFDNYSSTTKISNNVNLNSRADIWLVFLPGNSLTQINIDNETVTLKNYQTGGYYFIHNSEKIYINSDLKGDERKRWIIRALLYDMGFYGETGKYPDSVFYAGPNQASELSEIDLKAIQLMYGKKVTNGMTKSGVKSII